MVKGMNKLTRMKILRCLVIGIAAVSLLVTVVGVVGCEKQTVAGLYIKQDDPRVFIQLNKDGTFITLLGINGSWRVDGNELMLITILGAETWKIEGNKIIDPGGDVWVKKGS
jgi:hypothetical protein